MTLANIAIYIGLIVYVVARRMIGRPVGPPNKLFALPVIVAVVGWGDAASGLNKPAGLTFTVAGCAISLAFRLLRGRADRLPARDGALRPVDLAVPRRPDADGTPMSTRVVPLALSISNAYLLLGEHPVLVDAGVPGEETRLLEALGAHGVTPEDLSLIALTHGHTDHTGSVNGVAAAGAPVAIGAADAGLLEASANGVLPSTGPAGALLRPYIKRMTFAGASPQIRVTDPLRLEPTGLPGSWCRSAGTPPARLCCCSTGGRGRSVTWSAAVSPTASSGPVTRFGVTSPRAKRRSGAPSKRFSRTSRPCCSPGTADRRAHPAYVGASTPSHLTD